MYVGSALMGLGALEVFINEQYMSGDVWYDPSYALFMFAGDLLLLLWMWGVSIQVWRCSGVDYMKLLSLEKTTLVSMERPDETVYANARELSIVFLATFVCFNMTQRGLFHWGEREGDTGTYDRNTFQIVHVLPLLMIAYFTYRTITPWPIKKTWFWFLLKVICAPLYQVDFQAGYIGDLLTSLVRVLISMAYSAIYFLLVPIGIFTTSYDAAGSSSSAQGKEEDSKMTGFQYIRESSWWHSSGVVQILIIPTLTLMPLLIRLFQCLRRSVETGQRWPHIANATKYTSAIAVVSAGTFAPVVKTSWLWIASFVGATCYQFLWDITMDWGLIVKTESPQAQVNTAFGGLALRKHRLLGPIYHYLLIMAGNLFLRFAWTLNLVQQSSSYATDKENEENIGTMNSLSLLLVSMFSHLTPVIAAAEVMRRMVWGFLRLEWEHVEKMIQEFGDKDTHISDQDQDQDPLSRIHSQKEEGDKAEAEELDSVGMQRMDMASTDAYPNFYATWDPDGRLHSILPYLAHFTTCCASIDFPAIFKANDHQSTVPIWLVDSLCDHHLLHWLYMDMINKSSSSSCSSGASGDGDEEILMLAQRRRRFAEAVLFASTVLVYISLLLAYRIAGYGK